MSHTEDTIPGQLAELRADIRAELRVTSFRMDIFERRLEENTIFTKENTAIAMQVKDLIDMQNTARVGYKFAWGLGKFIAWAGAAAGGLLAIWALITHGKP